MPSLHSVTTALYIFTIQMDKSLYIFTIQIDKSLKMPMHQMQLQKY